MRTARFPTATRFLLRFHGGLLLIPVGVFHYSDGILAPATKSGRSPGFRISSSIDFSLREQLLGSGFAGYFLPTRFHERSFTDEVLSGYRSDEVRFSRRCKFRGSVSRRTPRSPLLLSSWKIGKAKTSLSPSCTNDRGDLSVSISPSRHCLVTAT